MSFILTTSAAIIRKAGANASSTITASGAAIQNWCDQSEGLVNVTTRFNWNDSYSTLNVDVKGILDQVTSDIAAMYLIQYDMSGYTSRYEAETMLDVLRDSALRGLSVLRDFKQQTFIQGA